MHRKCEYVFIESFLISSFEKFKGGKTIAQVIIKLSKQLSHRCVFLPGDVATAMLNRAKNDFAVYFDSIKGGSATSTPIATMANSEHLQRCYGSDTCGWS